MKQGQTPKNFHDMQRKGWEVSRGKKPWNFGKKASDDVREKLRIAHLGKPNSNKGRTGWFKHTEEFKLNARKRALETVNKPPHGKGALSPSWKGGITPINARIRSSKEYKLWREAVFKRDNFTCIWCFQEGGVLNADHIKSFANFPELRFAIDNGRTLCVPCHKRTDNYCGKGEKRKS